MDLTLAEGGAFEAAERILHYRPRTRFVFLDDAVRDGNLYEVLRMGGAGYWTRQAALADIIAAVRAAGRGEAGFCEPLAKRLTFTGVHVNSCSSRPTSGAVWGDG